MQDSRDLSAESVRQALRAILFGKQLEDSPLLRLQTVERRAREAGGVAGRAERALVLAQLLEEIVRGRILKLRAGDEDLEASASAQDAQVEALRRDFASGNAEREAWAMLEARYFESHGLEMQAMAARIGVSRKTLTRRLARGHELLAEQLQERERAAQRPARAAGSIPRFPTGFIGRERERSELRALMAESPLVTLTGPGGIGKSRLAARLAHDLETSFPDGVWYVELAAIGRDEDLGRAVLQALDLREDPEAPAATSLARHIGAQEALLVLDNCEHLAAAVGALARSLLEACPNLQLLATSREELHTAGQAIYPVGPMHLPEGPSEEGRSALFYDGVQLFAARAGTGRPDFRLDRRSAGRIAAICATLEGIPLAIELAAARLRYLSLDELERRTADRFALLRDGRRALRPSHESLLATLEWSYSLLSHEERALLRRLSVFRGGWTLEAAESVCAGDTLAERDVLDLLSQLEAKSLVYVDHTGAGVRYGMLETVRVFAGDRLEERGRTARFRDRHLEHFAEELESMHVLWRGPEAKAAQARVRPEVPNVRAALRWSRAGGEWQRGVDLARGMGYYWIRTLGIAEAREEMDAFLAAIDDEASPSTKAMLLYRRAHYSFRLRDPEAARADLEVALELYRAEDDADGLLDVLNGLGNCHMEMGRYEEAHEIYLEVLERARRTGDTGRLFSPLLNLGSVARRQRRPDLARGYYEEALEHMRRGGYDVTAGYALYYLGRVASLEGDPIEARRHFEQSLATFRESGEVHFAALNRVELALLSMEDGRTDGLRAELQACIESVAEPMKMTGALITPLFALARLESMEGRPDRALRLAGAADAQRDPKIYVESPFEKERMDGIVAALRSSVPKDEAERRLAEGRALAHDELVRYALGRASWEELGPQASDRLRVGDEPEL